MPIRKAGSPSSISSPRTSESLWKTGGVSHECRDGQWVNSLLGMARFNPTQGFGAGFGAYHMEYEYANSSMPYKYMREAIQDVNSAGGDLIVGLTSTGLSKYLFLVGDDGTITGEVDEKSGSSWLVLPRPTFRSRWLSTIRWSMPTTKSTAPPTSRSTPRVFHSARSAWQPVRSCPTRCPLP